MEFYELHTYVGGKTGVYGPLCTEHAEALIEANDHIEIDLIEADEAHCIRCGAGAGTKAGTAGQ